MTETSQRTGLSESGSNKIHVLIVEDSKVVRDFLTHIIGRDPRLEVAGAAASAEEALRLFHRVRPDVVSMDIRLPGMNGLEATQRIMSETPTPIVVVSASIESDDLNISMNALKAGALAVVEKPVGTTHEDYETLSERLCTQLAIMSQVKVVRQRFNHQRPQGPGEAWLAARSRVSGRDRLTHEPPPHRPNDVQTHETLPDRSQVGMIGIVSSTGGPRALEQLLAGLPRNFPVPIALVQHITQSFHAGFVAWLNDNCPLAARTARHLEVPRPATIYVAPADHHLRFDGERFRLSHGDPVCAERPSGSELLGSLAESLGRRAMGIVLTGMGDDGAAGLLRIREAGGYTFAEDETTAVVYGMPAAAVQIGAACESLPLGAIAPRILERAFQPPKDSRESKVESPEPRTR